MNDKVGSGRSAIDLLPGKHTLSIYYREYIWVDSKKRKYYSVNTLKAIDVEVNLEAGCVYQLKAMVFNGNFFGFSFDKELSDPTIVERLEQSRINGKLANTPLAK